MDFSSSDITDNKANLLSGFPSAGQLAAALAGHVFPAYREVNGHIHTPYSFSAFKSLDEVFSMARNENIKALGINDFYVTDGYDEFYNGCIKNGIFPLFNIEFIGLMKEKQENGIRINDPNNPGRIYFCGKGLDYPFHLDPRLMEELSEVKRKTQEQIKEMIDKLNLIIGRYHPSLKLDFDEVKRKFARELVRERHLAKAIRVLAEENFTKPEDRIEFIGKLYGGKKSICGVNNPAALENEIRSNLLKAGGPAFVEEDESSFLDPVKIIRIIEDAGGIPCYPVLLDDSSDNFTEFEKDPEKLHDALLGLGTNLIELIPGRNNHDILKKFVDFFYEKGFVITFGTEHNTPEQAPLSVRARGNCELHPLLKEISWKGACVIAAHQYRRARGEKGFLSGKKTDIDQRREFEETGRNVIEYYLKHSGYEN